MADANVLIDYATASSHVLALVARHLGPVCVCRAMVIEEMEQLDEAECRALGLRIVDPTIEQLLDAGARRGRLSFYDHLCLPLAIHHRYGCWTNDRALRAACARAGVEARWGLEVMIDLVKLKVLSRQEAVETARAIRLVNPAHITTEILARFERKLAAGNEPSRRL